MQGHAASAAARRERSARIAATWAEMSLRSDSRDGPLRERVDVVRVFHPARIGRRSPPRRKPVRAAARPCPTPWRASGGRSGSETRRAAAGTRRRRRSRCRLRPARRCRRSGGAGFRSPVPGTHCPWGCWASRATSASRALVGCRKQRPDRERDSRLPSGTSRICTSFVAAATRYIP